jgi:hypothetical protein
MPGWVERDIHEMQRACTIGADADIMASHGHVPSITSLLDDSDILAAVVDAGPWNAVEIEPWLFVVHVEKSFCVVGGVGWFSMQSSS